MPSFLFQLPLTSLLHSANECSCTCQLGKLLYSSTPALLWSNKSIFLIFRNTFIIQSSLVGKILKHPKEKDKARGENKTQLHQHPVWGKLNKSVLINTLTNSGFLRHQIICYTDSLSHLCQAVKFWIPCNLLLSFHLHLCSHRLWPPDGFQFFGAFTAFISV